MKNKGSIICMIFFWVIVIIILTYFLVSAITGKRAFYWRGFEITDEEIVFDKSYDIESINKIKVLSSVGNVKFEESDNDAEVKVVVYGTNSDNLKVDLKDNVLKVDASEPKNVHISFGFIKYIKEIIVYIPKTYNKDISLELDYGSIEMIDLENASIEIDEDCGDIKLGKVKNIKIKNDYGDTDIDSVLNKLDIETNCGDLEINHLDLKENSIIKCDLGDVDIGSTNDIYIDTSVDLGDCKIKTNNRQAEVTLKIDMDCGDIKVEN